VQLIKAEAQQSGLAKN